MSALATRKATQPAKSSASAQFQLSIFPTAIGWFGLLGNSKGLSRMVFAHPSAKAAKQALGELAAGADEDDWSPQLRKKLENYAAGRKVSFDDVKIVRQRPLTEFQERVVEIVRSIPRGETLTYGEVAQLAGSPGAARAVGSVMSSNPVPVIVPCHRVVGACGSLGGFSAAGGIRTKQWMLDVESGNGTQIKG